MLCVHQILTVLVVSIFCLRNSLAKKTELGDRALWLTWCVNIIFGCVDRCRDNYYGDWMRRPLPENPFQGCKPVLQIGSNGNIDLLCFIIHSQSLNHQLVSLRRAKFGEKVEYWPDPTPRSANSDKRWAIS